MDKCDCYYEQETIVPVYSSMTGQYIDNQYKTVGICYGTKEREECYCEGDRSKCTFYKEKKMTNEQWLKELKGEELAKALIHEDSDSGFIWFVCPDGKGYYADDFIEYDTETAYKKAIEHTVKWLGEAREDGRN